MSYPSDLEDQPITQNNHATTSVESTHGDVQRRLTRKQLFYVFVPQGVGAAILDAAFNFGIACAMYRTTRNEIRLWPLNKNTIAGDMGVTVIIQGILTTLIAGEVVRGDVLAKRIEPFSFAWPDVAWWQDDKSGSQSWYKRRIAAVLSFLSPTQSLSLRQGGSSFVKSLVATLLRGFLISALYFFIFWPIAIAITAPLYGGIDMHGTWTPEIIKAVFGGLLGLFMNPLVAALVLGVHVANESESLSILAEPAVPAESVPKSIHHHDEGSRPSHIRIASTTILAKPPDIAKPKKLQDETAVV